MSFLTWAALAVAALVVAPLIAHLLRRRPPDEQEFAATALVPSSPAVAQRRTALEDRSLFAIRALAVLLLAILGATPFVTCSRLSLARDGGASVALTIVLDDSMSMRAALEPGEAPTRFERAKEAAAELLEGLGAGDAVAIVFAGKPARVALAATTNLDAARATVEAAEPTDRGTDLEGAVKIAAELLADLRQVDKRVVLLSDLADGGAAAPPLDVATGVKLWIPLEELRGARDDCGVVHADRRGRRLSVRIACSPNYGAEAAAAASSAAHNDEATPAPSAASGPRKAARRVEVRAGDRTLTSVPLRIDDTVDLVLKLPEDASEPDTMQLVAVVTGGDAIAADDEAPVVAIGGQLHVGVVSDVANARVATGGPPPVEQALKALDLGVQLRPLSAVPDRADELSQLGLLVVDDAPGFTPSQRRGLREWLDGGGVLLITLGSNAAHAPLGSSFAPMLPAIVRWAKTSPAGIDVASDELFGEVSIGLDELKPSGRAVLDLEDGSDFAVPVRWKDGAPFLLERHFGRGVAYVTTLPFDTDVSDLALRPGFLHLLKRLVDAARTLGGVARTSVGSTWVLDGFEEVSVAHIGARDQLTPVPLEQTPNGRAKRVAIDRIGSYELELDGNKTTRVAAMDEAEVDLAPRRSADEHGSSQLGGVEASVDASRYVAFGLLALLLAELLLRALARRRARPPVSARARGS